MQRGVFPWALAGLSLLPALLGNGEEDRIRNQMQMTRDPIMQREGLAIPPALISKGLPLLKQIGNPTAMGALASLGDNIVDEIFGDGRRKNTFRFKKGAPRMKHKGKFHRLGNKLATSTGNQIKKFFKKKKTRRMAKKGLHKVGRELFAPKKLRLESNPQDTPFAKQLRESIKMASPEVEHDFLHIGQTFNI